MLNKKITLVTDDGDDNVASFSKKEELQKELEKIESEFHYQTIIRHKTSYSLEKETMNEIRELESYKKIIKQIIRKYQNKNIYYNKEGEIITLEEYIKLGSNKKYKIVKQDTLKDETFISTIWLGLDYSFGDSLLIFETTVFKNKGNWGNKVERYGTEAEAIRGHEKIVKKHKS